MVGVFGDAGRPPDRAIEDSGDGGRPPDRAIEDSGDGGRPPDRAIEDSDDVGRRPARVAKSHIGAASEPESCWQDTIERTDPPTEVRSLYPQVARKAQRITDPAPL
ncbi:hypothetical protein T230_05930 [Tannerella sp. oral taxon BU063 isolate Cell 1/3]|uniref:Uncharacterized protein n=1 Tax=Tannerella sp. oral taxon BU063 isolate Cell 1/3 TaxID=1411022 RepID=W2CP27_9BACT|nr:hypothetical protein T230_05930 [Tannerella sp. oral taxon BU063 isolate Cell 1/3]